MIARQAVTSVAHAHEIKEQTWQRGGEGIILKRVAGRYHVGKRPANEWIKLKDCRHASLVIVGFLPGLLGSYSVVQLRDDEGCETTVKTLNDHERARFEDLAEKGQNPGIGRRLLIEYQERTPDGNYRHPRWDRWADE